MSVAVAGAGGLAARELVSPVVSLGVVLLVCALPLLRRRPALVLAIAALSIAGVGLVAYAGAGLASPGLYALCLVIVSASLAVGLRGALVVGLAAAATSTALLLGSGGSVEAPARALELWATQVAVFLGTSVFVGVAVRRLRAALQRSWVSERSARAALARRDEELQRRRAAEDKLREAVREAERANEAKSQFLAGMSHELRTPLNAIIGYSELLIEDSEDVGVAADLNRIRSSGRHLLALINDILDLAKIEAGRMRLVREWFDVSALVNDIAGFVIPAADQRGNMIVLDIDQQIGRVHADPVRVRQVVLNLLSNANKFTEDGMVFLRASRVERDGAPSLQISVQDTGIGITQEQLARLFQPFVQAESSIARRFGGTGLGLVLSARFVEMMEGSIEVESTPGEGSIFTVTLPVRSTSAELEERHEERIEAARAHPGDAVLCLDEDPRALDLLCRALESTGLFPIPGARVAEGLALAREHNPAAALIDVGYARGWETLTDLVARGVPTVVVSVDDDVGRSRDIGAAAHLVKPIERGALTATLRATLADARGDDDGAKADAGEG